MLVSAMVEASRLIAANPRRRIGPSELVGTYGPNNPANDGYGSLSSDPGEKIGRTKARDLGQAEKRVLASVR